MCSTHYSLAPKLEKVLGPMSDHYFQDLGSGLPPGVDIFWTDPEIFSKDYPKSHNHSLSGLISY